MTFALPPIFEYQQRALFTQHRYAIVEGSTKVGKTYPCTVWLLDQMGQHGRPGRNFWWVAPTIKQAKMAYDRIKTMLIGADRPKASWSSNDTDRTITIHGRGTAWFLTGEKPDNLFGEDVYAVVVDEATRVREEAWYAIRSVISATGGFVRIIGNVKGRKNWVAVMAANARSGNDPDTIYSKLTADDAVASGIMTPEELEDARRRLPHAVFRELYYAEPSDDGGNPFGIDHIRACVGDQSMSEPVVWGVDLAKSHDWVVAIALDANGVVCRFERWQSPWGMTIKRLTELIGGTAAYIDATGNGDPVVEALQRDGVGNIEGVKFTQQEKQRLMEGLAVAIQRREVTYPAGPIVEELELFEYEYTRSGVHYTAPDGAHDDCVCALALAVKGLPGATVGAYVEAFALE